MSSGGTGTAVKTKPGTETKPIPATADDCADEQRRKDEAQALIERRVELFARVENDLREAKAELEERAKELADLEAAEDGGRDHEEDLERARRRHATTKERVESLTNLHEEADAALGDAIKQESAADAALRRCQAEAGL